MHILILGGRGFFGTILTQQLRQNKKDTVTTFDRNKGGNQHIQGNVTTYSDVLNATKNIDCIINVVGLSPLRQPKHTTYEEVHVTAIKHIIASAKINKVKHIIHISALGANTQSRIPYFATKGKAEHLLNGSTIQTTILQPSLIIAPTHPIINNIIKMPIFIPTLQTKIQPICAHDIVKIIKPMLVQKKQKHENVQLAGSQTMTLYELFAKIKKVYNQIYIPLPKMLYMPVLYILAQTKIYGITKHQIASLHINNTTAQNDATKYLTLTPIDNCLKHT